MERETEAVRRPRGRPRSDTTHARILHAAEAIVREGDLSKLTIEGIAERAKVSKQTIYRWWDSAPDVAQEALVELNPAVMMPAAGGDLGSDLEAAIGPLIGSLAEGEGKYLKALLLGAIDREHYSIKFQEQVARPFQSAIGDVFLRGLARGYPQAPFDIAAATDLVLGAIAFRACLQRDFSEPGFKPDLIASWACPGPGTGPRLFDTEDCGVPASQEQDESGVRRRGRPRSDKARRGIVEAALALLEEKGNTGLTIEGIADRAGVSKQTIYRWWPSASHIVAEGILPASQQLVVGRDTGSLRGDLLAFFDPILDSLTPASTPALLAFLRQSLTDPDFGPVLFDKILKPYWDAITQAASRAIARGDLPDCINPAIIAEQIQGAIWSRAFRREPLLDRAFVDGVVNCWAAPWRKRSC